MAVVQKLAEMRQAHLTAAERVEQLDVPERIGDAEHQRHEHDGDDQDDRRRRVDVRFEAPAEPDASSALGGSFWLEIECRYAQRRPRKSVTSDQQPVSGPLVTALWSLVAGRWSHCFCDARNFCCAWVR